MIDAGTTSEAILKVEQGDTAQALKLGPDDNFPPVFATSRMIALMELAASRALVPLLEADQMSVGVTINVEHTAATPVGCTVRAVATYLGPQGKAHRFKVEAFDDAGAIGEGEHTRAIISTRRLMAGAEKRKPGTT
jgi:predicted thioesterase